jgi:hypothetical protein
LWPITWSDDDRQYTAWGDGFGFDGAATKKSYGISRIEGNPDSYSATDVFYGPGGSGRGKIAGIISIGGVLYMWRFEQDGSQTRTLIKSTNKGASITSTGVRFPVSTAPNLTPKAIVQFGRDNDAAVDAYTYSVMADAGDGDNVYLLRVPTAQIESQGSYEVFSGTPAAPAWSSNFSARNPIHNAGGGASFTTIQYFPALDQFVLISHPNGDLGDLSIHAGHNVYGPWTVLGRYTNWCGHAGESTAAVLQHHIAPRWIDAAVASGQLRFWAVFSGAGGWDRFNTIPSTLSTN